MGIIRVDGNCMPPSVFFKFRRTTPMRKMMEAYCARCIQTLACCTFIFNSVRILPEQTAEQLDMQEGSRVLCTITQDTAESILLLSKKAKTTRIDSSKLVIENNGLHECMICAHVYWPPVLCSDGHTMCQGADPESVSIAACLRAPLTSSLTRPDTASAQALVSLNASGTRHYFFVELSRVLSLCFTGETSSKFFYGEQRVRRSCTTATSRVPCDATASSPRSRRRTLS